MQGTEEQDQILDLPHQEVQPKPKYNWLSSVALMMLVVGVVTMFLEFEYYRIILVIGVFALIARLILKVAHQKSRSSALIHEGGRICILTALTLILSEIEAGRYVLYFGIAWYGFAFFYRIIAQRR